MDKIEEVLTRGVDKIYPTKEALEKVLKSGKKLRVYQGFDPTSPILHLGHMVGLRKLRQWQKLGHEVIFLIGDFTGTIGDPTGKEATRPLLSKEVVNKNAKTYKEQAAKILSFSGKNPVKIKFNSEWLEKLSMPEIFNLASQVTYQQVIKRGMFKKRLQNDKDISINEILYPVMQGYDSVAMDVDVEVGGSDQLFNMMMGRDLMHKMKRKNKFVMTTPLLVDSEGNKLGKTSGNAIALTAPPEEIFGAVMNFPDDTIAKGLEHLTDVPLGDINNIEKDIREGQNPLRFKKRLAFEVVAQLNSENAAKAAQVNFKETFQDGQPPKDIEKIEIESGETLVNLIAKVTGSKSEAKRLIEQKAIEIDGKVATGQKLNLKYGQTIKIGKKKFVKVKIS